MKISPSVLNAPFLEACSALFLFLLCFLIVHAVKLIRFGWKYQKQNKTPRPPPAPPPKEEVKPVYYLVERKKGKRKKYASPKEIRFKQS